MADAIEIAKAIANNNGRTQYVGRVPSDIEVLAYALLAQQAVVEAAGHQTDCADNLPNPDAGYEKNRVARVDAYHKATDATERAVRAMRETKR